MSRWKTLVFLSTRIAVTNLTLPLASDPSMTIAPVFCSTMPCHRVMPSFFCVAEEAFACMTTPVTTFAVVGLAGGAGAAQPIPAPAVMARQVTSIMQRLRIDIEILHDEKSVGSAGAREAELSGDSASEARVSRREGVTQRSVARLQRGHRRSSSVGGARPLRQPPAGTHNVVHPACRPRPGARSARMPKNPVRRGVILDRRRRRLPGPGAIGGRLRP